MIYADAISPTRPLTAAQKPRDFERKALVRSARFLLELASARSNWGPDTER